MVAKKEMNEFFAERSQTYLFLAQVFFKELTVEAIEQLTIADHSQETGNQKLDQGFQMVRRYLKFKNNDPRTQLACEYARIFLGSGRYNEAKDIAAPYESVFTSEEQLVMQDSRDDVTRFFREDGFIVNANLHEPEDHLSFELEYLSSMSARAAELLKEENWSGLLTNMKRQQQFIDEHLLNWLPALLNTAQKYAQLTFYIGMLLITEGYLNDNQDFLSEACVLIEELQSVASVA